ncbi:MAG: AMP-dependent synthetase/ligase [Burkholderiaceae bacterium]
MPAPDAPITDAPTLAALLRARVAATPEREAYRAFDAAAGRWQSLSWAQAGARVARWRDALAAMGLPAGARVAVLLPNGLDAMCIDQACLALALVPVPLHAIDNPGSIGYILDDSAASLLVVVQRRQWQAVAQTGVAAAALRQVVTTGEDDGPAEDIARLPAGRVPVSPLADWLARGVPSADHPGPRPDDLAALVYTSGTTGRPKGVKLSHRNVVANLQAVLQRVQPRADDVFLSFLPLSHTFERTAGYYLAVACGSCVAYARSVAQLADDLVEHRPTVLVSVPRIYERVHAALGEAVAASPLKARLLAWTIAIGWRRFRAQQGLSPDAEGRPIWLDALTWPLLRRLVARPVLARFGGRVRVAVSGGAALSPAVARTFLGLGLPVLQGYGMTETSPVVSANGLDDNDPASVGRPLAGVQVRIGEHRELQVRGPSVMLGYWNRDEDTARTIDAEGWLGTGDQAEIVGGRIYIRGRLKDIIVTSTGEKVPPVDLELALCEDPLIEQAFVVGEHRPFIGAVVVLNRDEWRRLAFSLGLDWQDPASLAQASARDAVLARMAQRAAGFPRYAVPRAVVLSLEPWTVENTLLTPTLKLKRLNLQDRFEQALAAMYAPR